MLRGAPLDMGGVLISQGRWKAIFVHLRLGCISTTPCGHLSISPIFPTKMFISQNIQPPWLSGGFTPCRHLRPSSGRTYSFHPDTYRTYREHADIAIGHNTKAFIYLVMDHWGKVKVFWH